MYGWVLHQQCWTSSQVETIATATCRDGEDGKPCMPSADAVNLRYDPPQTQEPAQTAQVFA